MNITAGKNNFRYGKKKEMQHGNTRGGIKLGEAHCGIISAGKKKDVP